MLKFFILLDGFGGDLLQEPAGFVQPRLARPAGPKPVGTGVILVVPYPVLHHFAKPVRLQALPGVFALMAVRMVLVMSMMSMMSMMCFFSVMHTAILPLFPGVGQVEGPPLTACFKKVFPLDGAPPIDPDLTV